MAWTAPRTWASGETVTAAIMNTHVRDNQKTLSDAWATYTPTLTNWTLGNGVLDAAFTQVGKWVRFRIKVTGGSTTVFGGAPILTLPVTAVGSRLFTFTAAFFDTSAAVTVAGFAFNSTTTNLLFRTDASAALSATVPFTWATGDELFLSGEYEAA